MHVSRPNDLDVVLYHRSSTLNCDSYIIMVTPYVKNIYTITWQQWKNLSNCLDDNMCTNSRWQPTPRGIETRTIIFDNFQIHLHRVVKDTHLNNFGYKLVEFCKNNDIYLVNGRVGSDKAVGGLTCKGSRTVDYVVASAHMIKFIHGFDIIDFCNLYSDVHNPISFSISPVALNLDSSESIVETQSSGNFGHWTEQIIFKITLISLRSRP